MAALSVQSSSGAAPRPGSAARSSEFAATPPTIATRSARPLGRLQRALDESADDRPLVRGREVGAPASSSSPGARAPRRGAPSSRRRRRSRAPALGRPGTRTPRGRRHGRAGRSRRRPDSRARAAARPCRRPRRRRRRASCRSPGSRRDPGRRAAVCGRRSRAGRERAARAAARGRATRRGRAGGRPGRAAAPPQAIPLAAVRPTSSAPINPGPWVTATYSISPRVTPARRAPRDDRRNELEVTPRGDLRDDAAVASVQLGLRGDDVREDVSRAGDDRRGGLVARCLDSENHRAAGACDPGPAT